MRLLAPLSRWRPIAFIRAFWLSLNFAQRCYVSATLICIVGAMQQHDEGFYHLGLFIALIALAQEFWPKFHRFWESLPGKAIILFFYAFVANYALVQAAGLVNDITGVAAEHFPYTHNIAVLLSIPSWFFLTTIIVLLLAQIAMPFYILALLLLRPFGSHALWHPPHYRFPATTAILRFGFCLALLLQLTMFLQSSGMSKGVNETLNGIASGFNGLIPEDVQNSFDNGLEISYKGVSKAEQRNSLELTYRNKNSTELSPTSDTELGNSADQQTPPNVDLTAQPALSAVKQESEVKLLELQQQMSREQEELNQQAYDTRLKQFLANFIFFQEADERSRCEHSPDSRIVELNDFEIVEISKDPAQPARYRFEVKPCISAALGHQFRVQP
ncbi:hypothetical protein ACFOEE_10660 [Pseudoalteromonas fenneropenaei]|uniref:Uncharacterized protein n=1 Tax=Pseudoalteromonas fenneropenaei TaxID=1737459 RepID=A0ABV7CK33_9GAMM